MGLALLNFGVDEFINPRLRAAGLSKRGMRKAGLPRHPKLGLTPVVRTRTPQAAAAATTAGPAKVAR
jgi:peptide/nickel transport system permease protein